MFGRLTAASLFLLVASILSAAADAAVVDPPSKDAEIDKAANLFGPVKADPKPAAKKEKKANDSGSSDTPPDTTVKGDGKDAASDLPKDDAKEEEKAEGDEHAEEKLEEGAFNGVAVGLLDANGMLPNDVKIQRAMKVESAFIRRVCKLTEEQELHLTGLDKKWVKKNVRMPGNQVVNGVVVFNGGHMASSAETVRRVVVKALAKEMTNVLTEEQMATYRRETEIRETFDKDARIDAMVYLLDEKLFLRDDQREAIRAVLAKATLGDFEPVNYINNPQYLPTLPDASIIKHLDVEQKRVYLGVQKVTFGVGEQDLPVIDR
jgi:hypothetical protein